MENSRGKPSGIIWGLWLGLAVVGGISVYYYPLFVLTMFAVPAVWAVMAFRTHPVLLIVAGALVFLFGYLMGYDAVSCLCILGMAAPAGCFLWYSQRERMGNFQSVLYVSVLLTFGLFLIFCLPDLLASGDPYASLRSYFAGVPEMFAGTSLEASAQMLASRVDELIVACFFAFAGIYALVNVLLLHALNKGKTMPLCPLGPFGTWSTPFGYMMVLGALGLAVNILALVADTPMISAASLLFFEMWALPLLVTGANVLYTLFTRRFPGSRGKVMFAVVLITAMLFLYQIAQMALLLLGFVGVVRRRRAGKERR